MPKRLTSPSSPGKKKYSASLSWTEKANLILEYLETGQKLTRFYHICKKRKRWTRTPI